MAVTSDFVGRQHELTEGMAALDAGQSLLIKGREGIGKSAYLRELHRRYADKQVCLWLSDSSTRQALLDLLAQLHAQTTLRIPGRLIAGKYRARTLRDGRGQWDWIQAALGRLAIRQLADILLASLQNKNVVVFVNSLSGSANRADILIELLKIAQLVARLAEEQHLKSVKKILPYFDRTIELPPLSMDERRSLIDTQLQTVSLEFDSAEIRKHFIKAVEQDSEGLPAAVKGMLKRAAADKQVTAKNVRSFRHEPSVTYLDMTSLFMLAMLVLIAMRYISRGVSDVELYVISGVASTVFWGLLMLMRKLKA